MSTYRINKKSNYTTIDNNIFKNTELSFKATGLLTTMLSLPDSWDFSEEGLTHLKLDNKKSIKSGLKELEEHGYLVRNRIRDSKGRLKETIYDIYEEPKCHFQTLEKQTLDNQTLEKDTQLNTNIINNLNNKKLNNKKEIYKERFIKPTLEEIETYCKERNNNVDPKTFYDFYEAGDWKDSKGNKVKNWKQKVITWERDSKAKPQVEKKSKQRLFFEEMMRKAEEEDRLEQERSNNLNGQD